MTNKNIRVNDCVIYFIISGRFKFLESFIANTLIVIYSQIVFHIQCAGPNPEILNCKYLKTYIHYRDVQYGDGTEILPSLKMICTIFNAAVTI